eukprot:15714389-Heterocapsa_arctica.AAC.1
MIIKKQTKGGRRGRKGLASMSLIGSLTPPFVQPPRAGGVSLDRVQAELVDRLDRHLLADGAPPVAVEVGDVVVMA